MNTGKLSEDVIALMSSLLTLANPLISSANKLTLDMWRFARTMNPPSIAESSAFLGLVPL